jgi:hypothetical protein
MRIPIEKLEVIEASRREPEQGPSHQKSVPTDAGEAADGGGARCRRIVAEAGAGTGKK